MRRINEGYREFLVMRDKKRQRAVQAAIENWIKQMKANEMASQEADDKDVA